MAVETEERTRDVIIKTVFKEASLRQRQEEEAILTQDLMDALEELTNLPRWELEQIVDRAVSSRHREEDTFLSIKQQLMFASVAVLAFLCAPLTAAWMF
jgi:hypothetical protein